MEKPNIAEWFRNAPDTVPEELSKHVDCEHALKIVVLSDDFAFIYDKNLMDVHALFNRDHKTMLFMNGRMDDKEFKASNNGDNIIELFTW